MTLPADTRDAVGPYLVELVVRDLAGDDRVEVRWTVDPSDAPAPTVSPAEPTPERADVLVAGIPGQPAGSLVAYTLAVVRDGADLACAPASEESSDACPPAARFGFVVLGPTGGCRVDSDCPPGAICAAGACRAYSGDRCLPTDEGPACPGGYTCDAKQDLCVIAVPP